MALEDALESGPGHCGYAYRADELCVACGRAVIRDLFGQADLTEDECRDTESCPQPIYFGEDDQGRHCSECGAHLYGPKD